MKKVPGLMAVLLVALALSSSAQPKATPARLALVVEEPDAAPVADALTSILSKETNLALVERLEIEKIYQEQSLSAANKDYLKLGRLLGADGLLVLDIFKNKTATNLTTRLVAVKSGVILSEGSFNWPLTNVAHWAESFPRRLEMFIPKLTVLAKDALPISVVNLRCATQSANSSDTERQVRLLAIQRLSQERQFFVLERQKMQMLSEEKELKLDDSAFWSGSYLLEGVIDQNGYSDQTITINARLTPPKGGVPVAIEVSGSRTNYAEMINRLAAKVLETLHVGPSAPQWQAADEAAQYYAEAQWALRWGEIAEARSAADSAWALGKHDMDCATLRVKAAISGLETGSYRRTIFTGNGHKYAPREFFEIAGYAAAPGKAYGVVWRTLDSVNADSFNVVWAVDFPNTGALDSAIHALDIYREFCETLPQDSLRPDSSWYHLGVEALTTASRILQHFCFVHEAQPPAAEKLAQLRQAARSVARPLAESPAIRAGYFVGNRVATHDELANMYDKGQDIFSCEASWGAFWQEKPEDALDLYRKLMSSPVFSYIHADFWCRELQSPRLAAWNESDRQRMPTLWNGYLQELDGSSNMLLRLEAEALRVADADNKTEFAAHATNLCTLMIENRDQLVSNKVDILYLAWATQGLLSWNAGSDAARDIPELERRYNSDWWPKLGAMEQEYWSKTVPAAKFEGEFERQKRYLRESHPFESSSFMGTFLSRNYTRSQALEIRPLIVDYRSNAVQGIGDTSARDKANKWQVKSQMDSLLKSVDAIIDPPPPSPSPTATAPVNRVVRAPVRPNRTATADSKPPPGARTITVKKFLELPAEGLPGDEIFDLKFVAHHLVEGKLLLDFKYTAHEYQRDNNGVAATYHIMYYSGIAVLDRATLHWDVVTFPPMAVDQQSFFFHRSALVGGKLYSSNGKHIRAYDSVARQWNDLQIGDYGNVELFGIDGRLYAANETVILEVALDGKSSRVLVSTRRNPSVAPPDQMGSLGTPTLFEGPGHSLRAALGGSLWSLVNDEWKQQSGILPSLTPEIFEEGALLHLGEWSDEAALLFLPKEGDQRQTYLQDTARLGGPVMRFTPKPQKEKALWPMPVGTPLRGSAAAVRGRDLFLFSQHADAREIQGTATEMAKTEILPRDGYHATLFRFSPGESQVQAALLKFESPTGRPPVIPADPNRPVFMMQNLEGGTWMLPTGESLYLGVDCAMIPSRIIAGRLGIWAVPLSEIDSAVDAQKTEQLAARAKQSATDEAAKKEIIAKYDHNHNATLEPEEKEEALADRAYVELMLDEIDANHNGVLDAEELAYFDANHNHTLEPNEQTGIELAQNLLAARMLKQFDRHGDGGLDQAEFADLRETVFPRDIKPGMPPMMQSFPDDNRDGRVDLSELERYVNLQLWKQLRPARTGGPVFPRLPPGNPLAGHPETNKPVDRHQLFKDSVEAYWQKSAGASARATAGQAP